MRECGNTAWEQDWEHCSTCDRSGCVSHSSHRPWQRKAEPWRRNAGVNGVLAVMCLACRSRAGPHTPARVCGRLGLSNVTWLHKCYGCAIFSYSWKGTKTELCGSINGFMHAKILESLSPQWPAGEQPWCLTVLLICLGWQGEVSFLQVFVSLGIPLCLTSDKEMMVHLTIKALSTSCLCIY